MPVERDKLKRVDGTREWWRHILKAFCLIYHLGQRQSLSSSISKVGTSQHCMEQDISDSVETAREEGIDDDRFELVEKLDIK